MACLSSGGGTSCSATPGSATATSEVTPSAYPPTPSFPHNVTPSARYGASIALFWNYTNGPLISQVVPLSSTIDVLLFGGANSSGYVFNDTWQFNTGTLSWWDVTPYLRCTSTTCPGPRHDATAVWDSEDQYTLLFGGCTVAAPVWTQSVPGCGSSSSDIKSDTWYYSDPSGGVGAWTLLSPGTTPPARYAEGLADDTSDRYVVMFGGCGTTCPLADTWKFLAGSWTNLNPATHPTGRYGLALASASGNNSTAATVLTLFGGCTTVAAGCILGSGSSGAVNDTWLFYAGAWHQELTVVQCTSASVVCPAPRFFMGQTRYDGPGGIPELLLYGGVGQGGVVLGTEVEPSGSWWAFESWANPAVWAAFPSPPGWTSPSTVNSTTPIGPGWYGPSPIGPPADRYDSAFVGTLQNGALLFGGSSLSGSSLGDTWYATDLPARHSGLQWPTPVPSAQYGGSMVYDYTDRYSVLVGGCGPHCGNGTTWTYTANTWEPWVPIAGTSGPAARMNESMVYFNDSAVPSPPVVLFGGEATNGTLLNDTWTFVGGVWALAPLVAHTAQPSPRQGAAFAYNSSANAAVLFGGCGATCPLGDTWILTYNPGPANFKWSKVTPTTSPTARYGASMTFDARDNRITLFGGCGASCPLADTWNYSSTPAAWIKCTGAICTGTSAPPARWGASMTYESADREVVLFGGCGATCPLGDTWTYFRGGWAKLLPATSPPARYDAPMANDTRGGYAFMVGGVGINGQTLGGFGWVFQVNNWATIGVPQQLPRAPVPTARFGSSLAYNQTGEYVLLFGGCQSTGIGSCGPLTNQADTWEFVNGTWRWICTNCGPSARWDAGLAFDAQKNYFLLVDGCSALSSVCSSSTTLNSSWKFGAGAWTHLANPPFPARGDASMTYDANPSDNLVILFGGIGCGTVCGDSWRYSGTSWTAVTTPAPPRARYGAAIAYDALLTDKKVVLYGGRDDSGYIEKDTWTYTAATGWVNVTAIVLGYVVPALYDSTMTYDALDGYIVMYGGAVLGGIPDGSAFYFAGITGNVSLPPPVLTVGARWGAAMVYDSTAGPNGFTLLFGGCHAYAETVAGTTGVTGPGQGDTWEYLGDPNPPNGPGVTTVLSTWLEATSYW
jgi:hypothetical protein